MWWLFSIGLYFFISRAAVVFYYAASGDEEWRMVLTGLDSHNKTIIPVYIPVAGDIWFLFVIFLITFYHPLLWIGNSGEWINRKIAEKNLRKAEVQKRQKEYLDNLAQYGLTPKDIPAYAKEPAALKEYLQAWQTVNGKGRTQAHA